MASDQALSLSLKITPFGVLSAVLGPLIAMILNDARPLQVAVEFEPTAAAEDGSKFRTFPRSPEFRPAPLRRWPSLAMASRPAAMPAPDGVFVSTVVIPGMGEAKNIFVLADGSRLIATASNAILLLLPTGRLATVAGCAGEDGALADGTGMKARFDSPAGITVDKTGNIVVSDLHSHALRSVTKEGAVVTTLAGNGEEDFTDGQGAEARFSEPTSVVLAANGRTLVADTNNDSIRIVTPGGAVKTLAGNGEDGFVDGQGSTVRFNQPRGLALDLDGNLLVADSWNHAIRKVTMAGVVTTLVGGQQGFSDGPLASAQFYLPLDIVVDGEGTIIVADSGNHRLRKIVDGQVTTLAGSSDSGTADGPGATARLHEPFSVALDERGRLLVLENLRKDTLRVVEAGLAPPLWMGPVQEVLSVPEGKTLGQHAAMEKLQEDFGKMLDDNDLSDVVLIVEGQRFPAHRCVLAARSEYFRGLFLSGMLEGSQNGVQEIKLEEVTAEAFRTIQTYLYTADVPALGQDDSVAGKAKHRALLREVLKAADLFQACLPCVCIWLSAVPVSSDFFFWPVPVRVCVLCGLPFSVSVSISVSISVPIFISVSVCISIFFSVSVSISISVPVSVSISVLVSVSVTVCVTFLYLFLCLCLCLCLVAVSHVSVALRACPSTASVWRVCFTLQRTACIALQRTATHCCASVRRVCSTLQRTASTATHCSTLQHTAAHCHTLQHTAGHCCASVRFVCLCLHPPSCVYVHTYIHTYARPQT